MKTLDIAIMMGVVCGVLLTGCATKSSITRGEADAKRPINCATAAADIQILEQEKVNAAQQFAAGASSILPIGAVVNLLDKTEGTQLKVGFGEYNRMLNAKIAEIKKECNIE
jgi:hypothetical protein